VLAGAQERPRAGVVRRAPTVLLRREEAGLSRDRGRVMAVHGSRRGGVEVVARGGPSADEAERTLAAYRHAVRLGAGTVACDVRITRDGARVCVHDRRVDPVSTGRGVISALALAEPEMFDSRRAVVALRRP
jgi:glycerophosphoryl diester phosphodiesterase